MKRALLGLLVACLSLGIASAALAGPNENAGVSLHISKPTSKASKCSDFELSRVLSQNATNAFNTKGVPCSQGTGSFDVWVVVCNGSDSVGVAGVEFGIDYDGASGSGVDMFPENWRLCADLDFPEASWPAAGTGTIVTWATCQNINLVQSPPQENTAYAVAGFFQVTVNGQDRMEVTGRPTTGQLKVADCNSVEENLTGALVARGGVASFCSNQAGYSYCRDKKLALEPTTWGKVKSLYGGEN